MKSLKDQLSAINDIMGTNRSERVICFGKYSGENLSDIPDSYLNWLLNHGKIDLSLKRDIEIELDRKDRKELK